MERWREQLERTRRYFRRMQLQPEPSAVEEWCDDALSFFVNCHSILDWLSNDPTFPNRDQVIKFARGDDALSDCADIANGSKHLVLDRPHPRPTPELHRSATIEVPVARAYAKGHPPTILTGGKVVAEPDDSMPELPPPADEPGDSSGFKYSLAFTVRGTRREALDLAERCLAAWDGFVAQSFGKPISEK